jgi:hypothetical protein
MGVGFSLLEEKVVGVWRRPAAERTGGVWRAAPVSQPIAEVARGSLEMGIGVSLLKEKIVGRSVELSCSGENWRSMADGAGFSASGGGRSGLRCGR